jgi:hypothetical protein
MKYRFACKAFLVLAGLLALSATLLTAQSQPATSTQPSTQAAPASAAAVAPAVAEPVVPKPAEEGPAKAELKEGTPADSGTTSVPATKSASATSRPRGFAISYLESDRKWQLGFRHEPYNKISSHLQEQLVKELSQKEIEKTDKVEGDCCWIKIELLQVSTREAVIKKPGIDVAANLIVTDAHNKVVYSKGYSGKSGTAFMNTWGHLIDHACEDVSKNMAADENLLAVLRTGKLD